MISNNPIVKIWLEASKIALSELAPPDTFFWLYSQATDDFFNTFPPEN